MQERSVNLESYGCKGYWTTPPLPTVLKHGTQCHWLWTGPHNNGTDKSTKAGLSVEWGNASHTRNHQGHTHWDHEVHARPPTNANQTESGAGQSILQCRRHPHNPFHEAVKDKGMQIGMGQVLDGASRGLNTASMPADRGQAIQGVETVPKPILVSLQDTPATKLGKALLRWPAGKTESEIKLLIQENSKPQDLIVYTDGSLSKDQSGWSFTVKQGVTTVHEDSAAYMVSTSSLTREVEAVTHTLCPKRWQSDHTCHHPDGSNELATKSEKWNGKPRLECQWSTSTFQNSSVCTALDMPKWREMIEHIDWQAQQPSQVACFSEDLKCWEAWDTTCGHKAKDITPLIAWRRKALKEEVLDNLPWKDQRGPSSIRWTLESFQRQHWGNFERRGGAHWYHLELNWTDWRNRLDENGYTSMLTDVNLLAVWFLTAAFRKRERLGEAYKGFPQCLDITLNQTPQCLDTTLNQTKLIIYHKRIGLPYQLTSSIGNTSELGLSP